MDGWIIKVHTEMDRFLVDLYQMFLVCRFHSCRWMEGYHLHLLDVKGEIQEGESGKEREMDGFLIVVYL
jgi:hypothetical protein